MQENFEILMEDYLQGRLSSTAELQFRQRLETDESFAQSFAQHQMAMKVIEAMGDQEMMQQIKTIHKTALAEQQPSNVFSRWKLSVAAGFLMLCAVAAWLCWPAADSQNLYAQYYQPFELNFTSRSASQDELLAKANELYQSKDFAAAEPLFAEALRADAAASKVKLGLAICQMETGQSEKAQQLFSEMIAKDFDLYKEHSQWYSALIHVDQKNKSAAIPLLRSLSQNEQSIFYSKAIELLAALQ